MNLSSDLKVGDKVVLVTSGFSRDRYDPQPLMVTRIGKLFIEAKGEGEPQKFRRNGYRWGSPSYHGSFIVDYKKDEFEEAIREQREHDQIRSISNKLYDIKWKDQSLALLRDVKAVILKHNPELIEPKKQ